MDVLRQTGSLTETNSKPIGRPRASTSRLIQTLRGPVMPFLMHHRLVILISVVILTLLGMLLENLIVIRLSEPANLLVDVLVCLVIVTPLIWLLLRLVESTETARQQAAYDQNMHCELSHSLGSAGTWDELVRRIVDYPHRVAPHASVTLFVYSPQTIRMQPEATCLPDGKISLRPVLSISPDSVPIGSLPNLLAQNQAWPGDPADLDEVYIRGAASAPLPPNRYHLPITHNQQQIGVLKLEYPLEEQPSEEEARALENAAPVIALALEGALMRKIAGEQAAANETQRLQIAQNLHDSLAQNISYLRLKLDQLTGENAICETSGMLPELERMRVTADEAYQQVRNILDELNPIRDEELDIVLKKQARAISQRAGFNLRTSQVGTAYALPAPVRQQIVYIVREALHNIEKHACAHQVVMQFLWLETELILKISDDGVGFNPLAAPVDGHYGLWIMRHRAQEIGGTLKINPIDGTERDQRGTEVTLWVPRPAQSTLSSG